MNRPLTEFCKQNFADFCDDLTQNWAVPIKSVAARKVQLRGIHRRYLAFACTTTVVAERAARSEYLCAVAEVAYLSMVLAAKGIENTSGVLLRQCIELILKHLYFTTHPVEYAWAQSHEGYRELTFQFLVEYCGKTQESTDFHGANQVYADLAGHFASLSRYVHVHSRRFIKYGKRRNTKQCDQASMCRLKDVADHLWPVLGFLLILHFPRKFNRASIMEQKLMQSGLTKDLRQRLTQHLRMVSLKA